MEEKVKEKVVIVVCVRALGASNESVMLEERGIEMWGMLGGYACNKNQHKYTEKGKRKKHHKL